MESRQSEIWAVLWVTFALATISIGFRLFSRFLKKVAFWWDDFFAIGSYVVAIAWLITCPIWLANGVGMHIEDVTWMTPSQVVYESKLILFIGEITYTFGLYFAKLSILFFYWRLFHITGMKIPILVLMGMATTWCIIRTFMGIFQCVPVSASWDFTKSNAHCSINKKTFFFGSVLAHLFIDVLIVSLPILQIGKLQLRKMQKIGMIALFLFGALICICAIEIVISAARFNTTSMDVTWNITDIVVWATAEINLVTVSICFPTILPAFMFFFSRCIPGSILVPGSNSKEVEIGYSHSTRNLNSQGREKQHKLNILPPYRYEEYSSTSKLVHEDSIGDNNRDFESRAFDTSHTDDLRTAIDGRDDNRVSDRAVEEGQAGIFGASIEKEITATF